MKIKWLQCVAFVVGLSTLSFALSPWTSQPQTSAPLQGTILSCTSVQVSSVTATLVLAANAVREALYVQNTSTGTVVPIVWISSFAYSPAAGSTDLAQIGVPGFQLIQSSGTTAGTSLQMNGGAIWQGAVYGLGNANNIVAGRVTACELNP